jgi:hypothetical protein
MMAGEKNVGGGCDRPPEATDRTAAPRKPWCAPAIDVIPLESSQAGTHPGNPEPNSQS